MENELRVNQNGVTVAGSLGPLSNFLTANKNQCDLGESFIVYLINRAHSKSKSSDDLNFLRLLNQIAFHTSNLKNLTFSIQMTTLAKWQGKTHVHVSKRQTLPNFNNSHILPPLSESKQNLIKMA